MPKLHLFLSKTKDFDRLFHNQIIRYDQICRLVPGNPMPLGTHFDPSPLPGVLVGWELLLGEMLRVGLVNWNALFVPCLERTLSKEGIS